MPASRRRKLKVPSTSSKGRPADMPSSSMRRLAGSRYTRSDCAQDKSIVRVIQYIDDNFSQTIKSAELSRLANMSATKLKKLFRQFTGCTITEYILSKKTDYASHLLADSDLSIEELAKKVGFDTVAGFSTLFKKQTGIPPSEYRKRIGFNCLKNPSEIKNLTFENSNTEAESS